ncbi:MAG TPA: hypothetical protein VI248_26425 [Kineosporiaceae bacterium]
MNDDEIRRNLHARLPEHRDGFWDDLRRGLQVATTSSVAVLTPREAVREVRPNGSGGTASGLPSPHPGVAGVRPPRTSPLPRGLTWRWAAAAAAVGIGAGLLIWPGPLRAEITSWSGVGDSTIELKSSASPTSPVSRGAGLPAGGGVGGSAAGPTSGWSDPSAAATGQAAAPTSTAAAAPALPIEVTALSSQATQAAAAVVTGLARLTPVAAVRWLRDGGIATLGTPLSALSWVDRQGRNVLLITRSGPVTGQGSITMRAYLAARLGTSTHLVATVSQRAPGLRLGAGLPAVADVDRNGLAEATVGWLIPAATSAASPTAVVAVMAQGHEYVVRAARSAASAVTKAVPPGVQSAVQSVVPPAVQSAVQAAVPTLPGGVSVPDAGAAVDRAVGPVMTLLSAVPAADSWPTGLYPAAQQALRQLLS